MNKSTSKHYSLLFQDETNFKEDILSIHNDRLSDEDEDDYDGFKSMIGDDNEIPEDIEDIDESDDIDEIDASDEEIFNQHRQLSNEGLRISAASAFRRKNEYQLLTNGEVDQKSLAFETPLSTVWTPTPMSPVRRAFFLASIMLGVLVVAMFLWALPCDVQPCHNNLNASPRQWFTEINNIGLNYTKLLEKMNGDLSLFLGFYKVDKFIDHMNESQANKDGGINLNPKKCGLLRMNEREGTERWRVNLDECPRIINCDLMDSTGDGLLDCLVLGHQSLAMMFEPIYGSVFWHVHNKVNSSIQMEYLHFDSPISLQDLDFDGFLELLFPAFNSESKDERSLLLLVSGRTGTIMGKPFTLQSCYQIVKIYKEDTSIGYSCLMENRSELIGKIPLTNLLNEISKDFDQDQLNDTTELKYAKTLIENNDAVCQIKYTNKGKCPYCKTRIEFGFASDNPVYKEFQYSSVVSWNILSSGNVCKGVILKLWKWDKSSLEKAFLESTTTPTPSSSKEINEPKSTTKLNMNVINDAINFALDPDDMIVDDPMQYRDTPDYDFTSIAEGNKPPLRTNRQAVYPSSKSVYDFALDAKYKHTSDAEYPSEDATLPPSSMIPPENTQLHRLEEVLVLATYNGSDWISKDLGSMIVYQLCQISCLPSHFSQENTVLIDKSLYERNSWNIYASSSTFSSFREEPANSSTTWVLESYVRKLMVDVSQHKSIL